MNIINLDFEIDGLVFSIDEDKVISYMEKLRKSLWEVKSPFFEVKTVLGQYWDKKVRIEINVNSKEIGYWEDYTEMIDYIENKIRAKLLCDNLYKEK